MTDQDAAQDAKPESGARNLSRRIRAVAGLADQAFTAGANAVNGLVAGYLLGPAPFGRYVAVIGVAFITIAVTRAFIGEVLLTHTARATGEEYRTQVRDASATAIGVGAVAIAIAVGIWAIGFDLLRDLLWLAPFLPAALLADAGRYAFLSQRRPQRALLITGVGLLTQLVVIGVLVVVGTVTTGSLLAAWGAGMVAGSIVTLALLYLNPIAGKPQRWIGTTRHLSGWFLATAVLSQTYNWAVLYFVGGYLGDEDLGGLRMLQMLVLMPVQNLIWALTGMIVPGYSGFAERGDVARIQHRTRFLVTGYLGVFGVILALVPVGQWLVDLVLPEYAPYRGLMWPIALQAGFYMIQSPLNAALRGMQQARHSFMQYVIFTAVVLPASLLGALWYGVTGAAYGLVVGAIAGGIGAYVMYVRALHRIAADRPLEPAAE